jgi:hypothetical protein
VLVLVVTAAHAAPRGDTIVVLTQNQYLGADLTPLGAAFPDPVALNQAVLTLLAQIRVVLSR